MNNELFKPGEILVVAPQLNDLWQGGCDPVALACSGKRCKFVAYGTVTGHAIVTLDNETKRTHFQPQDLRRIGDVQK